MILGHLATHGDAFAHWNGEIDLGARLDGLTAVALNAHDGAADVDLMIDDVAEKSALDDPALENVRPHAGCGRAEAYGLGADRDRYRSATSVEPVAHPHADRLLADTHAPFAATALDEEAGQLVHQAHEVGDELVGR